MVSPDNAEATGASLKSPPVVVPTLPPMAGAAAAAGGGAPPQQQPPQHATAEQQKQFAEFNQWLYRWNNYQQHLAHYWQGRYHALYQQMGGGGKVKGKKGKKNKQQTDVELKWNMRYQELLEFKEERE